MEHFHIREVLALLDDSNTTTGSNETDTNSTSSLSSSSSVEFRVSNLVDHLNHFIAALYGVLMLASLAVLIYKLRISVKMRTGLLYTCYVLAMVVVRFAYMVAPATGWVKILLSNHGSSKMCFLDLLPELLFISIFLLMTITLAIAWTKTRKVKVFRDRTVMLIHTGIVCFMYFISGMLSVGVKNNQIHYIVVINWEAYFIITLSGVAVILSSIMGVALYLTFYRTAKKVEKAKNLTHQKFMTHLLVLICLTVISFILKGVWNLVLGSVARTKWRKFEMGNGAFGTLWFGYYFFTELLPLGLALYQQFNAERLRANSSEEFKGPSTQLSNKYTTRSSGDDSKKSSIPKYDADGSHSSSVEMTETRREGAGYTVRIADQSNGVLGQSSDSLRSGDSLNSLKSEDSLRSSAGGLDGSDSNV